MGKLTRVLEKSGYEVKLETLKTLKSEPEVEFNLAEEGKLGTDAKQGAKVEIVYQDREKDPIINEEWDDRLRRIVNRYRTSTESFSQLRSKFFSRNKK